MLKQIKKPTATARHIGTALILLLDNGKKPKVKDSRVKNHKGKW